MASGVANVKLEQIRMWIKHIMLKKWIKALPILVTVCMIFNSGSALAQKPTNPNDPYESFNRAMFQFNEFVDRFFLKPAGQLYNAIVPHPLAKGLTNFFNNVDNVPTVINDVLQGNFYQASSDVWRLAINTTIGIGGLFDVAQRMGLEPNSEDFGLTLAQWGYNNSTYLVLPFLGSTTFRDGFIGFPTTYYGMSVYPYINPTRTRYELYMGSIIVRRADVLTYEGLLNQMSFDKYVFMRDAYIQHRNYLIQRNKELNDPYIEKDKLQEEEAETASAESQAAETTAPFSNA